ncbi:MAG: DUF47 family protein [Myxococcales bacterium]|nr:DUF47 family protein [Myxococcales bacterium]
MRLTLARLLGRNPLAEVSTLMAAAQACTAPVPALVEALIAGDQATVVDQAKAISRLEAEADRAKAALRDRLPRSLLLPVDRRDLLHLIVEIDAMADCAEDAGVLLTWRALTVPPELEGLLRSLVQQVMATVDAAAEVVQGLDELLQSAFSGPAAAAQQARIKALGAAEHRVDKVQDQIAKRLFGDDALPAAELVLWTRFLQALGDIANHAENVGEHMRLFLAR